MTTQLEQFNKLHDAAGAAQKRARAITATAQDERRDLTTEESASVEALMDSHDALKAQASIVGGTAPGMPRPNYGTPLNGAPRGAFGVMPNVPNVFDAGATGPETWFTSKGEPVRVLASTDRMASLPEYAVDPELLAEAGRQPSLGLWLRGVSTGNWNGARLECALSGTSNISGGYLVPGPIAAQVIDRVRAQSVLIRLGAKTVPMSSDKLSIARVTGDMTFAAKAQNSPFSESSMTFDAMTLVGHTIGGVQYASRELVDDAPNMPELLERTIATALAAEIDRLGLMGTGSIEPVGLLNLEDVQEIASVASPTWTDFIDAIEVVEDDNHVPTGAVYSANTKKSLASLLVNSEANHYVAVPQGVEQLRRLVTESVGNATAFVGDFTRFIIGVRSDIRIELTTEGGSTFANHQLGIKPWWRGDFAAEHGTAFAKLTGIT